MLNTLVYNDSVNKGLQSVLFMPSVQYDPLQTLVNVIICARGLYGEPLVNMCNSFIHFTKLLHFVA